MMWLSPKCPKTAVAQVASPIGVLDMRHCEQSSLLTPPTYTGPGHQGHRASPVAGTVVPPMVQQSPGRAVLLQPWPTPLPFFLVFICVPGTVLLHGHWGVRHRMSGLCGGQISPTRPVYYKGNGLTGMQRLSSPHTLCSAPLPVQSPKMPKPRGG